MPYWRLPRAWGAVAPYEQRVLAFTVPACPALWEHLGLVQVLMSLHTLWESRLQTSARYQGQLVGIPLDGRLFLMYYR